MMSGTYEMSFVLTARDCDRCGAWRPSAVLEAMQESAGAHCDLLSCGREDMLKHGAAWVIARTELHMDRYPRIGDPVTVNTFPMPQHLRLFPRWFTFTGGHGEVYGKASSFWLLMDLETRRMLDPSVIGVRMPDNSGITPPMRYPAAVSAVTGETTVSEYTPVWTDLDMNGHVNNARYADWLCNALGTGTMNSRSVSSLVLNYDHECLPGEPLTLSLTHRGDDFRLRGSREAKAMFDIGGSLRVKEE